MSTLSVSSRDSGYPTIFRSTTSIQHTLVRPTRSRSGPPRSLGSANGIYHEGRKVEDVTVKGGAIVRFGDIEATFEEL